MKQIKLPDPQKDLKFPLMKALDKRRTKRKWNSQLLTIQEISNICWVACGETKPATSVSKNRRTVPSGCNAQLITIYVALDSGVYKYCETDHILVQITEADVRLIIGNQKMMQNAPLALIYIADFSKRTGIIKSDTIDKMLAAGTEAGMMSQNVYLYCAATNLNTVLIGLLDRNRLKNQLELKEHEYVVYTQVIGKAPEKK